MARGVNKVILVGNCGSDPEMRYTPDGRPICNITLATSESWKDKQTGQLQERTEWHRVVLFGKVAEIAGEYLRKGSQVYIEGSLRTRKWQGQDGQDRYTTEIHVSIDGTMQLLGGTGQSEAPRPQNAPRQGQQNTHPARKPPQKPNQSQNQPPQPDYDSFDDDIPF